MFVLGESLGQADHAAPRLVDHWHAVRSVAHKFARLGSGTLSDYSPLLSNRILTIVLFFVVFLFSRCTFQIKPSFPYLSLLLTIDDEEVLLSVLETLAIVLPGAHAPNEDRRLVQLLGYACVCVCVCVCVVVDCLF